MREKLIELLIDGLGESETLPHMYGEPMRTDFQKFADYLLENGVVMLPCKVGDTVYYPYKYHNKVLFMVEEQPEADVVEVVRCKDCKYYGQFSCTHPYVSHFCDKNDYCSYGKFLSNSASNGDDT